MQSDFHVHFPQEMAGLLAHMANEKNMDITTLIAELTIEGLRSEQTKFKFKGITDSSDTKKAWSTFSNKFDESEWTWSGL